jgi:hypothetical protein
MFDLSRLPIDVYHVIHQYLLNYDYHEFLNTSKAVFSEVKYRTMHYHLRYRDPFVQADAGIISDIVTTKVMNKCTQIFILYNFDCRFYETSVISSPRLNFYVPIDIHTLKLEDCYHTDNLCFTGREGGHLHTLEITYGADASLISTLLSFKDVQDLSLRAEFVSSDLPPGYSLSCQSLTLTSVEKQTCFPLRLNKPKKLSLDRFDLKNLTIDDITELEEVSLCDCSNFDMTLFRNAKKINIEHSADIGFANTLKISDLTSFLSHVSLVKCNIVDVSLLRNVRSVELALCTKLSSLEGLGTSTERRKGNHQVTIVNCPGVSDFSPLNGVYRVCIYSCVGFTDGHQVKDVNNLEISSCDEIESFHMFGKVYSLRIRMCFHLVTLFGLQDVPYLDISYCWNLKDIEGLKNNQYVGIRHCKLINRNREYYENLYSSFPHFSIT